MFKQSLQALKLVPLGLVLGGVAVANAQSLPPYAGSQCVNFSTQQEAQWHYTVGTAPDSLDDDGDGVACEYLTTYIRQDGNRIYTNQANRGSHVYRLEVWRVNNNDVYLHIKSTNGLDFTTRSFPSDPAARQHMNTYYKNLLY
ncbi:MAG TPA: excalibur calcium-binding domain-containing protein [Leptolyngbyaceae cyanobacterium]